MIVDHEIVGKCLSLVSVRSLQRLKGTTKLNAILFTGILHFNLTGPAVHSEAVGSRAEVSQQGLLQKFIVSNNLWREKVIVSGRKCAAPLT